MAICVECGKQFSDKRKALHYDTCLECGEELAQMEAHKRKLRIAPAFNKGAYQFITSIKMVKDLGRK
jgi:predicted  nucleic acid-binding Zn-ribbon protein